MNIYCIFLSNFFNYHQKSFSEAMYNKLGDRYLFIESEPMSDERKKMGWNNDGEYPYVVCSEKLAENIQKYIDIINNAQVVIMGSAPEYLVKERVKNGKLIFRYSERFFKNGLELSKYPVRYLRWHKYAPNNKPNYMLCASAYTSADFKKLSLFKNKCYKWGYFPQVKKYDDIDQLISKKKKNSILWVGRIIDWKHPEIAVKIAEKLKKENYDFSLNIIGTGNMEEEIKGLIKSCDLEKYVKFLGSMPPEKVREYMEESEIFLFTSDRREGWGAVLNESMNSGCAVVASHAIGSVPFLIEDGENGYIYRDGDVDDLFVKVKKLMDETLKRQTTGKKAYQTLADLWNAETATDRLLQLFESVLQGNKNPQLFEYGPCSKAEILSDGWYK